MFTKVKGPRIQILSNRIFRKTPLLHQLKPVLFRLLQTNITAHLLRDHVLKFAWEHVGECGCHIRCHPARTLRRNGSRRDDALCWVDKEEHEDLAVAWFRGVDEGEGGDGVLVDVWKYENTTGLWRWSELVRWGEDDYSTYRCVNPACILHHRIVSTNSVHADCAYIVILFKLHRALFYISDHDIIGVNPSRNVRD
jgi:hypothetical protein